MRMQSGSPRTLFGVAVVYLNRNLFGQPAPTMLTVLEWLLWVVDRNQPMNNLRWVIP